MKFFISLQLDPESLWRVFVICLLLSIDCGQATCSAQSIVSQEAQFYSERKVAALSDTHMVLICEDMH